jgi:hypothetical protein
VQSPELKPKEGRDEGREGKKREGRKEKKALFEGDEV